jgi:hypothetical protein
MTRARVLADYVAGGTTAAEFDHMDGVTSNVQTQLNAKAPLASPAFTGTVTSGDGTTDQYIDLKKGNSDKHGIIRFYREAGVDWSIGESSGQSGDPYELGGGTDFAIWQGSSPSAKLTVNASGDVKVNTGDLIFGTAGKGINLGVTANTDANTLDDYEEGTFTPTITFGGGTTGMSYGARIGYYTKIGQLVNFALQIRFTAKGSSSGDVRVGGLPFTAKSVLTSATHWTYIMTYSSGLQNRLDTEGTELRFENDNSATSFNENNFTNSSNFGLAGTYRVT